MTDGFVEFIKIYDNDDPENKALLRCIQNIVVHKTIGSYLVIFLIRILFKNLYMDKKLRTQSQLTYCLEMFAQLIATTTQE